MDLADLRGFGFHLGDQFVHSVEYRLNRFTLRQIDPRRLQLLYGFVIGALLPDNRPMSVAPYPSARLPTHCPNCQAVVHGPFCAQCGQETVTETLKLRDFSHEYFHRTLPPRVRAPDPFIFELELRDVFVAHVFDTGLVAAARRASGCVGDAIARRKKPF